jgi:hypothetical protein
VKWVMSVWTGFSWLRIGANDEKGDEISGSIKSRIFFFTSKETVMLKKILYLSRSQFLSSEYFNENCLIFLSLKFCSLCKVFNHRGHSPL